MTDTNTIGGFHPILRVMHLSFGFSNSAKNSYVVEYICQMEVKESFSTVFN